VACAAGTELGLQGRRAAHLAPRGPGAAAPSDPPRRWTRPTGPCLPDSPGCCLARARTGGSSGLRRCCVGIGSERRAYEAACSTATPRPPVRPVPAGTRRSVLDGCHPCVDLGTAGLQRRDYLADVLMLWCDSSENLHASHARPCDQPKIARSMEPGEGWLCCSTDQNPGSGASVRACQVAEPG
jgi:hypothetical protein